MQHCYHLKQSYGGLGMTLMKIAPCPPEKWAAPTSTAKKLKAIKMVSLRSSLLLSHDCCRLKHSILQCRGLEWKCSPSISIMTVSSFPCDGQCNITSQQSPGSEKWKKFIPCFHFTLCLMLLQSHTQDFIGILALIKKTMDLLEHISHMNGCLLLKKVK